MFSVVNNLNESNVLIVIITSLSLHTFLREKTCDTYTPPGFADEIQMDGNICNGIWRDEVSSKFARAKLIQFKNGEEISTIFKDYFYGPGAIS